MKRLKQEEIHLDEANAILTEQVENLKDEIYQVQMPISRTVEDVTFQLFKLIRK